METSGDPDDTLCGIGQWKPLWLQRMSNPKVYLGVHSLLGIFYGALFSYFSSIMSSLERRFAFDSKISGLIMIADNFSSFFVGIVLGYFGLRVHRPRTMAAGMFAVAISCFLSAIPYFIYGSGNRLLSKNMSLTIGEFCNSDKEEQTCDGTLNPTVTAVSILFVAAFVYGLGASTYYVVGTPYLDDIVGKRDSALYMGISMSVRVLGPAIGFLLSSFTLRYYEDPFHDPEISRKDPQWVGAWWMGYLILGICITSVSIPMTLFPRRMTGLMPKTKVKENPPVTEKTVEMIQAKTTKLLPSQGMSTAIMKMVKNPILVCEALAITFQLNGFLGYISFMPKYIASQYQQSDSFAGLLSGSISLLTSMLGILIGGIAIQKYRPGSRRLTAYIVIAEMSTVFGYLAAVFLGCPQDNLPGRLSTNYGEMELQNECNADCGCITKAFRPICGPGGTTYFSPCFAGCTGQNSSGGRTVFTNCSCLYDAGQNIFLLSDAASGYCPTTCNMLIPYVVVLIICKLFSSTARVGKLLVTLRSVNDEDKGLAIGVLTSAVSVLALIPYPLIFGALTDATCIVWEQTCGKTGNCWLYDRLKFRTNLHITSATFFFIGTCFDFAVYLLSSRLNNLYRDSEDQNKPNGDA